MKSKHTKQGKEEIYITIEQQKAVVRLYKEELSTVEISKRLCLGRTSVGKYLNKLGYRSNACRKITKSGQAQLVAMYNSGKTCREIVESGLFNLKEGGVLSIVRKNNATRSRGYRNFINHSYFRSIDSEEKAYFIGLLMADGSVQYDEYSKILSLELKIEDKYMVENLAGALCLQQGRVKESCVAYEDRKDKHNAYFRAYSQEICNDLQRFGIVPNKTLLLKEVPKNIEPKLIRHVIRGIFDGDGTVYTVPQGGKPKLRFGFYGTYELVSDIKRILMDKLSVRNRKVFKKTDVNVSMILWDVAEDITNFYHYIYDDATIYLLRKKQKFDEYISCVQDNTEVNSRIA